MSRPPQEGVRTCSDTPERARCRHSAPDAATLKGLRDRAILAVLVGCGLRRSEGASLTLAHIQQRDGRWCIVDLAGKHRRIRTVPMPWVKVAIDAWTSAARIDDGFVFWSVNRADRVGGTILSGKAVWQLIKPYAEVVGVPVIAPELTGLASPKNCFWIRRYAGSRR